jgi:hypothetical protein
MGTFVKVSERFCKSVWGVVKVLGEMGNGSICKSVRKVL